MDESESFNSIQSFYWDVLGTREMGPYVHLINMNKSLPFMYEGSTMLGIRLERIWIDSIPSSRQGSLYYHIMREFGLKRIEIDVDPITVRPSGGMKEFYWMYAHSKVAGRDVWYRTDPNIHIFASIKLERWGDGIYITVICINKEKYPRLYNYISKRGLELDDD
jgi:hypothetical protein